MFKHVDLMTIILKLKRLTIIHFLFVLFKTLFNFYLVKRNTFGELSF